MEQFYQKTKKKKRKKPNKHFQYYLAAGHHDRGHFRPSLAMTIILEMWPASRLFLSLACSVLTFNTGKDVADGRRY